MPKVKLIRNVAIDGRAHAAGEVVSVSERDAETLVALGRAEKVDKAKKKSRGGRET